MSARADCAHRPAVRAAGAVLVRRGAELVHVVEELYLRLLRLVLAFTLIGCGLSLWFGGLSGRHTPDGLTLGIAVVAAAFACWGLTRTREVYCWLRYDRARQLTPAVFAAVAVLLNGPDSPSWWVALPLLWVVAAVSSTRLTLAAACITALAYATGSLLGGEALLTSGETGILAAAVGLVANTMVGKLAAEVAARFMLHLHRLQCELAGHRPPPLKVVALQLRGVAESVEPTALRASAQPRRRCHLGRLTTRQLEVALLVRDGLRQAEIALCLGISPRQVERLLHEARARTGASTTSQLVAMLVTGRLAPEQGI
jgi:DNA-binding CsgD family transcriptional regulator